MRGNPKTRSVVLQGKPNIFVPRGATLYGGNLQMRPSVRKQGFPLHHGVTMSLSLRVKPGAQPPFDHRCGPETVIGRSEAADVSIPSHRFISKEHARVFEANSEWFVEDLDSTNETLLNGQVVAKPTQLFRVTSSGSRAALSKLARRSARMGSSPFARRTRF